MSNYQVYQGRVGLQQIKEQNCKQRGRNLGQVEKIRRDNWERKGWGSIMCTKSCFSLSQMYYEGSSNKECNDFLCWPRFYFLSKLSKCIFRFRYPIKIKYCKISPKEGTILQNILLSENRRVIGTMRKVSCVHSFAVGNVFNIYLMISAWRSQHRYCFI